MEFAQRAERYARAVLSGDVVAGKWVKAAAQRHLDDLARSTGAAADSDWPFEFKAELGNRVCSFIQLLPHVEGDYAKPVVVDGQLTYPKIILEDWQVFFIVGLFGWVRRGTALRRFRRAYLEVARKNAKSTLAAGLALYMLSADGEQGAQVWNAATKSDQARIVWSIAQRMVQREPDFRALAVAFTRKAIFQTSTGSTYGFVGRDSDTLDGLNTSCFISDELHAQKDRGLYDVLDSSTGARSQPLGIGITTAGSNTAGVCYEQRIYLSRILNRVLVRHGGMGYRVEGSEHDDDAYFGLIYTLDTGYADKSPDDDWADESKWIKANPNLDVSAKLDDLRAKCTKAKASPQSQGEFRTKHCNQWIAAEAAWMDMTRWHACGNAALSENDFLGEECVIGLDAAFKTDLFAKIKVFNRRGKFSIFGKYWVPEALLEQKGMDHLKAWATQGWIKISPGPVIDIELVREDIARDAELHVVKEVPFDPNQLTQFAGEMLRDGYLMVDLRPSVLNFSEPMKKIGELVLQGLLEHNGDPVLAWMIGNVIFHRDHKDNIYPNKLRPELKIDGVVALIMAMNRSLVVGEGPSVYEERGVMALG